MCVRMLSMFALMMLSLLGWGAYEVGEKLWDYKSTITSISVVVFNFPENAYQSIKVGQTNILKKPSQ